MDPDYKRVQLITSDTFPNDTLGCTQFEYFGATVSARSVKYQVRESSKSFDRDKAWSELREEIIGSTFALHCTHVLGYRETVSVY